MRLQGLKTGATTRVVGSEHALYALGNVRAKARTPSLENRFKLVLAVRGETKGSQTHIKVCTSKDCRRKGGRETLGRLRHLAPEGVQVLNSNCLSNCAWGPNVELRPSGVVQSDVSSFKAIEAVLSECVDGDNPALPAAIIALAEAEAKWASENSKP
ncbi:hypothetical protein CYMTET_54745 [Cymbomonas tetramitiformis]|uniref:(2Fe-2S) ferredoxin domain-containing protein n=1 Tax=Cymbomonas tetramitiformis TaxID=36881 RepID=A0AAE0BG28_9CHLO|nr:hypothetical protein CYMTET_54745 [Cymbomonas tetramitiformis]